MTYLKTNNLQVEATISGRIKDKDWNDRDSKTIRCFMSYEDAVNTFVDGLVWSIVYRADSRTDEHGNTIALDPVEYDNSEYSVAGSITDNRDGSISAKMGKLTDSEKLTVAESELNAAMIEMEEILEMTYGGV